MNITANTVSDYVEMNVSSSLPSVSMTPIQNGSKVDVSLDSKIIVRHENDYEQLKNKPQIESVTLSGNKTFEDLGLSSISNTDLMDLLTL